MPGVVVEVVGLVAGGVVVPRLIVVSVTIVVSVLTMAVSTRRISVVSIDWLEELSIPIALESTMVESLSAGSSAFGLQAARPKATRHPATINGREIMMSTHLN